MKKVVLILVLIAISTLTTYAQTNCFPGCGDGEHLSLDFYYFHPRCNLECRYTVFFTQCVIENEATFLVDSIRAYPDNDPCCQGTATNDPMITGYILESAARIVSAHGYGDDTVSVYTPSRCWKWVGTLGPFGIHDAVLVPCSTGISCCRITYVIEGGVSTMISRYSSGPMTCNEYEACMRICDYDY